MTTTSCGIQHWWSIDGIDGREWKEVGYGELTHLFLYKPYDHPDAPQWWFFMCDNFEVDHSAIHHGGLHTVTIRDSEKQRGSKQLNEFYPLASVEIIEPVNFVFWPKKGKDGTLKEKFLAIQPH